MSRTSDFLWIYIIVLSLIRDKINVLEVGYRICFRGDFMKNEVSRKIGSRGSFEGLYTFLEVAKIYGMDDSSLRKKVARGKFVIGVDVKKMGRTWIITEQAMVKNFGALKFEEHIKNHREKGNMIFNKNSSENKKKILNSKKNKLKGGKSNKKIFSMNEKEEKSKDSWANGEIKGVELKSFSFDMNSSE